MEDAGIKKAGIFSLIFSQKMGIMATAAPKWKSFLSQLGPYRKEGSLCKIRKRT